MKKMKKMKKRQVVLLTIIVIVAAILVLFFYHPDTPALSNTPASSPAPSDTPTLSDTPAPSNTAAPERLTIYSFNIQIFGVSKMAKPEVVSVLTDIVSQGDIIAIQEVRSATLDPVLQFMSLLPEHYGYVIGPREGRSTSKEQYWVIYDTTKVTVAGQDTYPAGDDRFERNPFAVYFRTVNGVFDFILIDNHIQPSSAGAEISILPEVVAYYQDLWGDSDVLVMGDFNADGGYYNESLLETVFPADAYQIIITNDYNTTVADSENTYDRFIITASAREDFTGNFGVIRFEDVYDFSLFTIQPKDISDHYPIWAEFYTDKDTD